MATVYNQVTLLQRRIRQLEARILNAADRGDDFHFSLWSNLLEKLEESLVIAEVAAETV